MKFVLAPELDVAALAARFREAGVVQIPTLLAGDGSECLYEILQNRTDWRQVLNSGDKVFELDRPMRAAMSAVETAKLDAAVYAGARSSFQYRYETIRVPDEKRDISDPLAAFATFLSAGPARDLLRKVTGRPDIAFADAQATAYSTGDFLTGHDDEVAGKGRLAAYVLSLSPDWRVEWGGLLLFHGPGGQVEGFAPRFGALNLFAVPKVHSVSTVVPSAPFPRYSVTGWLRSR